MNSTDFSSVSFEDYLGNIIVIISYSYIVFILIFSIFIFILIILFLSVLLVRFLKNVYIVFI